MRRGGHRRRPPGALNGLAFVIAVGLATPVPAEVLSPSDVRAVKAAFAAAKADKWKKARRLVASVKDPAPAKILRWFDFTRVGTDASFDAIGWFMVRNPDWPGQALLRRRAEEAIVDKTPQSVLSVWFARYPPISTPGMVRYGALRRASGAEAAGRALLRDAWINGNFSKREEQRFYRRYRKLITRQDHLTRMDRLLWEGRYWPAQRMLHKVNPRYRALSVARLRLMRMQRNVDGAIAKVPAELRDHPGLVYERLRWRRRKGLDTALEFLADTALGRVHPEKWWTERAILARRTLGKGHISEAYRVAKNHHLRPEAGLAFAEAEWLAGWIALQFLTDHEVALDHFTTMFAAVKFPVSRARGAYWAARAAEAEGKTKLAERWHRMAARYSTTYYGQLAASRLAPGNPFLWLPPDPQPAIAQIEAFDAHELVRVVRVLGRIGQKEHLRPFVLSLAAFDGSPSWQALTASLARRHGRPDLAILVAKRSGRAGPALIEAGYPTPNVPVLVNGARKPGPELPLVLAVIRQESAFRPEAISRAGARGLMQLLPSTARTVAKALKMRFSYRRLTAEPDFNMKLGQAYLGKLLEDFDGSYVLALAAYNAGPVRARKWLRANGDPRQSLTDAIDWVELIPIDETRNYVQLVMEGLQVYRGRLNGARAAITLERDLSR